MGEAFYYLVFNISFFGKKAKHPHIGSENTILPLPK